MKIEGREQIRGNHGDKERPQFGRVCTKEPPQHLPQDGLEEWKDPAPENEGRHERPRALDQANADTQQTNPKGGDQSVGVERHGTGHDTPDEPTSSSASHSASSSSRVIGFRSSQDLY